MLPYFCSLCSSSCVETLFFLGSGETAVPERNPTCPQRACMALSVWGEGEERAEPRKVSGQRCVTFTSSALLVGCCICRSVIFNFRITRVCCLDNTPSFYTDLESFISFFEQKNILEKMYVVYLRKYPCFEMFEILKSNCPHCCQCV